MARFPGVDYLLIDSLFSEQELLVRQTARQFVEDRVIPIIRDCYRDGRFPKELIPEIGQLGFLGANLEGYGCAGLSNVEYGLIMQEIERGDSGLRSFVSVQGALVMYPIYTYGSAEQKGSLAAENAIGRSHRMLWAHRAGLRIESRGHADAREAGRRPVDSERREDLDYERLHGRRRHRLGAHRGGHSRIPGGEGNARIHYVRYPRQAFDARLGDVQPGAVGLPRACVGDAARRAGAQRVR